MDATQGKSQDTGDIDDSGTEAVRQKSCGGWDLKDRLPFSLEIMYKLIGRNHLDMLPMGSLD